MNLLVKPSEGGGAPSFSGSNREVFRPSLITIHFFFLTRRAAAAARAARLGDHHATDLVHKGLDAQGSAQLACLEALPVRAFGLEAFELGAAHEELAAG